MGSGKGLLSKKKAENNSEDAEAQVVAQGQKHTVGSGKEVRRQRTTARIMRPW